MKIDHIAMWVNDLQGMKEFYEKYFRGISGELYHNPAKNFSSYFISFGEGCRLEIMYRPEIRNFNKKEDIQKIGSTHIAIAVGSKEKVDSLTELLESDGYRIVGPPRITGDGYYESVVLDPEGNRLEITI